MELGKLRPHTLSLAGLAGGPLCSHGRHVQSISGFASGASCDAGRPRLLSVSALLPLAPCPSMRRGVPACVVQAARTRQGRRTRVAGKPEKEARDFSGPSCMLPHAGG